MHEVLHFRCDELFKEKIASQQRWLPYDFKANAHSSHRITTENHLSCKSTSSFARTRKQTFPFYRSGNVSIRKCYNFCIDSFVDEASHMSLKDADCQQKSNIGAFLNLQFFFYNLICCFTYTVLHPTALFEIISIIAFGHN